MSSAVFVQSIASLEPTEFRTEVLDPEAFIVRLREYSERVQAAREEGILRQQQLAMGIPPQDIEHLAEGPTAEETSRAAVYKLFGEVVEDLLPIEKHLAECKINTSSRATHVGVHVDIPNTGDRLWMVGYTPEEAAIASGLASIGVGIGGDVAYAVTEFDRAGLSNPWKLKRVRPDTKPGQAEVIGFTRNIRDLIEPMLSHLEEAKVKELLNKIDRHDKIPGIEYTS